MAETGSLKDIIWTLIGDRKNLVVLDAGCGSYSVLRHIPAARRVGIDTSQDQLNKNTTVSEKIIGDIQTYPFGNERYDFIICRDVLEHLPRPELALKSFAHIVKPGGLILLVLPNILSVRALVAKFMPHIIHVFYYRRIHGWKEAGRNCGPFKTFLRFNLSASAFKRFAEREGLLVELCRTTHVPRPNEEKYKTLLWVWHLVCSLINRASLNKIGTDSSQSLQIILRKPT